MIVLETIREKFILLCVCPLDSNDPLIKARNIALSVSFFISDFYIFWFSLVFVLENIKFDLESSLHATMPLTITLAIMYVIVNGFILRHQITDIFSSFQDIYDKCM